MFKDKSSGTSNSNIRSSRADKGLWASGMNKIAKSMDLNNKSSSITSTGVPNQERTLSDIRSTCLASPSKPTAAMVNTDIAQTLMDIKLSIKELSDRQESLSHALVNMQTSMSAKLDALISNTRLPMREDIGLARTNLYPHIEPTAPALDAFRVHRRLP